MSNVSKMRCYVNVPFILQSQHFQLQAYVHLEKPIKELCIPFYDQSNGIATYGRGRYIEGSLLTL